jgi:hypothetical protein
MQAIDTMAATEGVEPPPAFSGLHNQLISLVLQQPNFAECPFIVTTL